METNKPNNPLVFPIINQGQVYESGMTLRDYFANSAMQSLINKMDDKFIRDPNYIPHFGVAEIAYNIADAMLKQREL